MSSVNPGVVEVCNNGVDDDCDGGAGPCAMVGDVDAGELVHAVTGAVGRIDVGDYTGDGLSDLMIHGENRSDWMAGPVSGILGTLTWDSGIYHFAGDSTSVASGDVNDDGVVDVLWSRNLELKLQPGPLQRGLLTPSSVAWLVAPTNVSWYGHEVSLSQLGRGVLRKSIGPGGIQASWAQHDDGGQGLNTGTATVSDPVTSGMYDGLSQSGFFSWDDTSVTWWAAPNLHAEPVNLPAEIVEPLAVMVAHGEWSGWLLVVHEPSQPQLTIVDASLDPNVWTAAGTVSLPVGATIVSGDFCDLTADGTKDLIVGFFLGQRANPTRYGLLVFEGPIVDPESSLLPIATILGAGIEMLACADMTGDGVEDIVASDSLNGFTEVLAGRGL
jgi:hypothetical protein